MNKYSQPATVVNSNLTIFRETQTAVHVHCIESYYVILQIAVNMHNTYIQLLINKELTQVRPSHFVCACVCVCVRPSQCQLHYISNQVLAMPTCETEFRVPKFNQWPLNCKLPSKFSVVCGSMEKARGGSSQDAGRPQNEGATQSTVFLGRDEEARELKSLKA